MSSRDEQLEALEAAVKSAESKLKTAKMSVDDIDRKIKSVDEAFEQKLAEKAIGYKEQTGADFSREVDVNGRVSYSFSREAKPKERRTLTIKRQFDSETGKVRYKVGFTDNGNQTVSVNSAKDLKKPNSRKKYIAFNLFGYRKLELSTEVNNPFLNTVGKPIIVPIQAAAKLVDKTEEFAKKISESSVGRGVADAAKIVSAPIVIPAKIVKDISDKGGVIHSISALGDKIKIEGVNVPKPLKTVASGTVSVAKGMETLAVNTAKSVNKFTIEIAKEKLYEEIHKGISENESTQAAYVIGVRAIDVYKVLNEHTKYKKAVRRDKAGNDITDTNVSRYLAGKEESKYQQKRDSLNEEKKAADYSAYNARKEYEAAKARLESYKRSKGIPVSEVQTDEIIYEKPKLTKTEKDIEKTKRKLKSVQNESYQRSKGIPVSEVQSDEIVHEKPKLTKTEKDIEKTKRKLKSVQNHKYRFKRQKVFIPQKGKVVSKVMLTRVEVTEPTPMTAWETRKKLEGLAVRDVGMSMRRKAMRDGGDNSGVEAANFAITAAQSATHIVKAIDNKEKELTEQHYEKKLHTLENKKGIENAVESVKPYEKSPDSKPPENKNKSSKSDSKQQQKNQIKKKHQKKVYKKKKKNAVSEVLEDLKRFAAKKAKGVGVILAIIALMILYPVFSLTMCSGGTPIESGMGTAAEILISPCSTVDLGQCDLYYTELAKNMIHMHQNIDSYYVDYNKYVCLTEINEISHSPEKLVPYVAVKALSDNGGDDWNFEQAKPYIEDVFNSQYEFYANEVHEIRKNVTTVTYRNENTYYSALGSSEYNLERPEGADIPNPLKSELYTHYANTYTHIELPIINGYIENTLDCVGVYTDENGQTTEYDDMQTITFQNFWQITLVFDYIDGEYQEYWVYTEQQQDYFEYDYYILEYAIKENAMDVPDSYWTDTDLRWLDNNFDKLIYNRVLAMNEDEQELFDGYFEYNMGHQELKTPYAEAEIARYPGYNNDIYGDMSLENGIVLYSSPGQQIICGMDGEITATENGFSVYNKKYGTLYYEGAAVPNVSTGVKGTPISTATGNTLKITVIDKDGNYINPLFIFSD